MRVPAFIVVALSFFTFSNTSAQELADTLRETHGDWQLHCASDPLGLEECFLFQAVDQPETGERVMTTIVAAPLGAEPLMRITVPLGVLLPNGLNMTIDAEDLGAVGFLTCFMEGCMTQVTVTDDVLTSLKAGNLASVTVFDTAGQPATLPLSLTGFTAGWNALNN